MKILIFILFFLVKISVCSSEEQAHFSNIQDSHLLIEKIIKDMDSSELIGQTLMFGYPGLAPNENMLSWISQGTLGSIRISGSNASSLEQLSKTILMYQEKALTSKFGIPLLIATDQEGGIVRHIRDISATPGNIALGADPIIKDSFIIGSIIGQELISIGINMNFAPVIDVFSNPLSEVIGPRAFSDNPYLTGILGLAFAKGQQEFGVISTAKHYPGHGNTDKDSHGTLPIINSNKEDLLQKDLIPYKIMIRGGVPAIMAGHLAFPNITGDSTPASLSKPLLTDLLRKKLDFSGVVITDDLYMRGARINNEPIHEIAYLSILAGADLLLISNGLTEYKTIMNRFLREMETNTEFNNRIYESAARIIKMKAKWQKKPHGKSEYLDKETINSFLLTQAARSITLIRDYRFPISPETAGKVLLAGNYGYFFFEGQKRFPNADTLQINYRETKTGLQQNGIKLASLARNYDTVITLLPDFNIAILLNELKNLGDKIIVFSVLSPSSLKAMPWVKTALAIYGTNQEAFKTAFAALNGDFFPEGRLPISSELE